MEKFDKCMLSRLLGRHTPPDVQPVRRAFVSFVAGKPCQEADAINAGRCSTNGGQKEFREIRPTPNAAHAHHCHAKRTELYSRPALVFAKYYWPAAH